MKENFAKFSHSLIFAIVIGALLTSTLFLLPTTSEFFEFNKFTLILVMTVLGATIWSIRMFIEKKFVFTRTPLDIPLIIYLLVFFVSTLSSVDQFGSVAGIMGRIWPSFFALLTVGIFYFMVVSNLKSKKQVEIILWTLVSGTAIASIISILSYFGVFLPFDFAQVRSFNTLGVINRLALLEAFVIPLTVYWSLFSKNKNIRLTATLTTIIMSFSFVLINTLPAYIALGAGLAFLGIASLKSSWNKNAQSAAAILAVFFLLFLALRHVPQIATGTIGAWISSDDKNLELSKEIRLSNKISWDVATQAIGKRPLLGTGPGTFPFAYTQLKPRYINATDQWAVRFDKPSSDFTEVLTTTGIFGALAYLVFIIVILRFVWTLIFKSTHGETYLPLASMLIASLAGMLVTVTSISTIVPFFIILAALAILAKAADENYVYDISVELATLKNKFAWFPIGTTNEVVKTSTETRGAKSQVLPGVFLVIILICSIMALNYQIRAYRGEYFYRQALLAARSNDGNKTVTHLQNAIRSNPRVDTYHRVLSNTSLNAAVNLSQRGNLTQDQQNLLLQLAQVAIDQGKVASGYQILPLRLPGISAANVANWESLAAVYQAMIGSISGADVHAVNALSQAVSLDPQNAILHDRLGLLYQRLQNKDLAQRKFEDAIIVKGDFGPAHYHLAKLLIENQGDVARIVNELNSAKRTLPENDPAMSDIDQNLETYNKRLQDLQSQIQDQQADQNQNEDASPSPSASPSGSPSASPTPSPEEEPSPSPSF